MCSCKNLPKFDIYTSMFECRYVNYQVTKVKKVKLGIVLLNQTIGIGNSHKTINQLFNSMYTKKEPSFIILDQLLVVYRPYHILLNGDKRCSFANKKTYLVHLVTDMDIDELPLCTNQSVVNRVGLIMIGAKCVIVRSTRVGVEPFIFMKHSPALLASNHLYGKSLFIRFKNLNSN